MTEVQQTEIDLYLLQPGWSYRDPVGGAVVLVLTAPELPGQLRCNGVAMVPSRPLPCSYHSGMRAAAYLRPGWRYRDTHSGLEVRCLRSGCGYLTYGQRTLSLVRA
jgi:hypothetical protein